MASRWRLRLLAILSIGLLGLGAAPAEAIDATDMDASLVFDPAVRTGELDNGLRYYVRANREPENRAELRLVLNAGSLQEDDDQLGLAHFVEHMAFNGTKHFEKQALVEYLESIGMSFGADINASTSFDQTIYMLEIPTDDDAIVRNAFQILEDWGHGIRFDPVEIDKERGVVIEEWRGRRGAGQRIFDQQAPILLKDSRYLDRLPIGTKESLESFTHDRLERFYRDWYRPDLMAVVAVGDFDELEIESLIQEFFGRMKNPDTPRLRVEFDIPTQDEVLISIATDPEATSSSFSLSQRLPREPMRTVGDARRSLAESMYNSMLNARLAEFPQRADSPFLWAGSSAGAAFRTTSSYSLRVGFVDGGLPRAVNALLLESNRARQHGFGEGELERQKARTLRSIRRAYEERDNTPSARLVGRYVSHFLSEAPSIGFEASYELYSTLIPTLSLDEVLAAGAHWLATDDRIVLVTGTEAEDNPLPEEAELRQLLADAAQLSAAPYVDEVGDAPLLAVLPTPGTVVMESRSDATDVTEWTLSNGVRVLLKPTKFREDEIIMSAFSPGGSSLLDDAANARVLAATNFVDAGGLGELSAIALGKRLAGRRVSVTPRIGTLEEGLRGSASPEDLELWMQLIYLQFTAPRRDDVAFTALQERYRGFIANQSLNPMSAYQDTLRVTLAQHHPRYQPVTMATVEGIDYDACLDFYRDRFADASDFVFVFVGSFDLAEMRPLIEQYLGGLPASQRKETWRDVEAEGPEGIVERSVFAGQDDKSQTGIYWSGDFEWTRRNRYVISSLSEHLDTVMREALREDLGGTYGVSVSATRGRDPKPQYSFSVGFGSAPDRVDELVTELWRVVADLKANPPTAEDVQKITEGQRRSYEQGLQENGWWLSQIQFRHRYDRPQDETLEFLDLVDSLSAEELSEAARRYLLEDAFVRVSLYPEGYDGGQ